MDPVSGYEAQPDQGHLCSAVSTRSDAFTVCRCRLPLTKQTLLAQPSLTAVTIVMQLVVLNESPFVRRVGINALLLLAVQSNPRQGSPEMCD